MTLKIPWTCFFFSGLSLFSHWFYCRHQPFSNKRGRERERINDYRIHSVLLWLVHGLSSRSYLAKYNWHYHNIMIVTAMNIQYVCVQTAISLTDATYRVRRICDPKCLMMRTPRCDLMMSTGNSSSSSST